MNWNLESNTLTKEFEFKNFKEAIHFVNQIFPLAEAENHHPDILIHDYKKVKISLSTHSKGTVTEKDYALAEKIETIPKNNL